MQICDPPPLINYVGPIKIRFCWAIVSRAVAEKLHTVLLGIVIV